ncbi:hypothetical protein [Rhodoflexus caldus]|uniref:hypothetical protein n=1 Tax=Rhodoflexus caldus TaxID=2891236 RepID=UPI00202A1024|nr:hypothetical protein [Rhodoflexus caldus]
MRTLLLSFIVFWLYAFAQAQIAPEFFRCEAQSADTAQLQANLAALSDNVLKDLPESEEKRLRTIFRRIFNKYLKHYRQGSTLANVLQSGHYDCLSGTIVFAHVLRQAGFQTVVYETNIHVFLTVVLGNGVEVLIETTDPINGLVTSPTMVARRKEEYIRRFAAYREQEASHYRSEFQIMRAIPFEELAGLQCFNRAVTAYNNKQFALAADYLFQSQSLMTTERGMELMILSLEGILAHHSLTSEKQLALLDAIEQYKSKLSRLPKLAVYK